MNDKKGRFIVALVGGSCVGKTTLESKMINELNYSPVIICTTRKSRKDDPEHYKFFSEEEFSNYEKKDSFDYSFVSSEDTRYGYILPEKELCVVSFINSKDAKTFLDMYSNDDKDHTYIFGITTSKDNIEECYKKRGMTKESIHNRNIATTNKYSDDVYDRSVAFNNVSILTNSFFSLISKDINYGK